ncbi:uncharacterized protein LOC135072370 isoform X1 [Ostrinia nubilalis]|uniref:uncharacterized protein LOC135072370 isoform X1 n=2 Tax=Ostrinia nubilalis TaxID=29057 RepID=UPI003082502C
MTDRSIASRPSMEQVMAIVEFMEKHPALALGQLRGLEGRDESKKLWLQLTMTVNNLSGPTRPMKSWVKYWADKKSTVRAKVQSTGGDPNTLCSNIEKKIWDLFLANDSTSTKQRNTSVKQETHFLDENFFNEDSIDQDHEEDPVLAFEEPIVDIEDRQMAIMDKLVKVMSEQASALTQMARASQVHSQAMERLADASHIQARAVERLAGSLEAVGGASHAVRDAIVDIDASLKRFYSASPT